MFLIPHYDTCIMFLKLIDGTNAMSLKTAGGASNASSKQGGIAGHCCDRAGVDSIRARLGWSRVDLHSVLSCEQSRAFRRLSEHSAGNCYGVLTVNSVLHCAVFYEDKVLSPENHFVSLTLDILSLQQTNSKGFRRVAICYMS